MRLILLSLGFLLSTAAGATDLAIHHETPLYASPSSEAHVLLYIQSGESVTSVEKVDEFRRVRINRAGKWRTGYIAESDAEVIELAMSAHVWGLGAGFDLTNLAQGGRAFETEDQVRYQTSTYRSQTISPYLSLQWHELSFWRASLAYKSSKYTATETNTVTAGQQNIRLQHQFVSFLLQKAFQPIPWKPLYAGVGIEVQKATKVSLSLGTGQLPTTSQQLPTYYGGMAFVGAQFFLAPKLSLHGEMSLEVIPNQSPMIYQYQLAACLMYWL